MKAEQLAENNCIARAHQGWRCRLGFHNWWLRSSFLPIEYEGMINTCVVKVCRRCNYNQIVAVAHERKKELF